MITYLTTILETGTGKAYNGALLPASPVCFEAKYGERATTNLALCAVIFLQHLNEGVFRKTSLAD